MASSSTSNTSSSSSDEELILLALALRKKNKKRKWVHEINKKREEFGEFHRLCVELSSFEDRFVNYFRMTREQFEEIYELISPRISKLITNWRKPIGSKERYLATGVSHNTIAFSYRVGRTTVSSIVKEVCVELWNVVQSLYLATPTEEVWKKSEIGFRERWNFPNCLGSIDGKHVRIKCPQMSGSNLYCYKNVFSIVLLAIIDPDYKFLIVDIGSYGRHSDSSIFENSSVYREFVQGKTNLPPKPLPGTTTPVPHVFVGDEGFKLEPFLIRPFLRAVVAQDNAKKIFNKRLSRARRVVENAFGILAQKWRVFFRPIELDVESTEHVVKAACCLHNYLRSTSTNATTTEQEEDNEVQPASAAFSNTPRLRERSSNIATSVRENLLNYFNYLRT